MRIGAIFDWDGVIIDSTKYHKKSWELLASEEGLELPRGHFRKSFGMRNKQIIPSILDWTNNSLEIERLSARKEELYRDIMTKKGIKPLKGAVEFIKLLRSFDVPIAIGTSTSRQNVELALDLLGIAELFDIIVCGEDVEEGKPSPQVFLMGAHKMMCNPEHCVVFEDAPAGVMAARNGGMKVVALTTTRSMNMLKNADIVIDSFDELDYMMFKELFASMSETVS